MNGPCPIALTSCILQASEGVTFVHLKMQVTAFVDSFQFAHQKNRSVDVLDNLYSHLEKSGFCISLIFYDFSSAFNTIYPHLFSETIKHECPCIHYKVDFRSSYKLPTVSRNTIVTQIVQSPTKFGIRTCYIRHHGSTQDIFCRSFCFLFYSRLSKLMSRY